MILPFHSNLAEFHWTACFKRPTNRTFRQDLAQFDFAGGRARSQRISKRKFFSWRRRRRRRQPLITQLLDRRIHGNSFKSRTNSAENHLEIFRCDLHVCATTCSCTDPEAFSVLPLLPGSSMSARLSLSLFFLLVLSPLNPRTLLIPVAKFNIFLARLYYQVPGRLFASNGRLLALSMITYTYIKWKVLPAFFRF